MTGISGCFFFSQEVAEDTLKEIVIKIKDEDCHIARSILNHSCLLAGLDIKSDKARKIITDKEDGISIVTCGEVYNEDNESLNEAILKLYKENRLDRLEAFNGSFAAAIYDGSKEKLTLVNDRYGLEKLFYYHNEEHFFFAPKIRPLVRLGANKSLRKDAIIDFFLFGFLLGDKTFFQHIRQLRPASILEVSKDGMNLTTYWDYEYNENYHTEPEEELIEKLDTLWQKAIERRVKGDKKILIPLSGGLDSRAILAAALKCTSKDRIITFAFGEKGSFDLEIGKMVAKKAGVKHIALGVEKEDFRGQYDISMDDIEGMIHATPYFAIKKYKEMGKYGDDILSGYMGGEIMGSLISARMLNKKMESEQDFIEAKNIIFDWRKRCDLGQLQQLISFQNGDIKNSFEETVSDITNVTSGDFINYCAKWLYKYEEWNQTAFCVFRYKNIFKYSMPFLDNDVVNFMLGISPELRVNKKLYRSMLLTKYPRLFEIPVTKNDGLKLDANRVSLFLRRVNIYSKRGVNRISRRLLKTSIFPDKDNNYIDYNDFLRKDKGYRNYMRSMIDKVEKREYFNEEYIEKIWDLHMQGRINYSMLFGLLVTFELLLERFVDK